MGSRPGDPGGSGMVRLGLYVEVIWRKAPTIVKLIKRMPEFAAVKSLDCWFAGGTRQIAGHERLAETHATRVPLRPQIRTVKVYEQF